MEEEIREGTRIQEPRTFYYSKRYFCINSACSTKSVVYPEDKVYLLPKPKPVIQIRYIKDFWAKYRNGDYTWRVEKENLSLQQSSTTGEK